MRIVVAVLLLLFLIVVHEWGHFITALKIGVPIEEFSIGYGPLLVKKIYGRVQYSFRLLPLGGYVRMTGDEEDWNDPNGFVNRKPWEKILIAAAGPFMNFVAAILLFIVIYSFLGIPAALDEPVFGGVLEGTPAEAAGIQTGDRCVQVNGETVESWNDFTTQVAAAREGEALSLVLQRGGDEFTVDVQPFYDEEQGRLIVGVYSTVVYEKVSVFRAIPAGFQQTWHMTVLLAEGMKMLFTGEAGADDISGPIGITTMIGDAAREGMIELLAFIALLSVNLGLLNLLPIPALDGSKILLAVIEWIRRKRLDPEKESHIQWIGLLLLLGLMALATVNDIEHVIGQ